MTLQIISDDGPAYTVKQAAGLADVNIKTLYAAIKNGDCPSFRLGKKVVRIPRPAFNALLRDGKIGDGQAA